jgi:hypothetical protein
VKRIALLTLALAGCDAEPQPAQPDTLPTPSGPPVAQQAPQPSQPPLPTGPQWESAVRGEGMALRLAEGGQLRMEIACLPPARLTVNVPGFTTIGSEDRFSLGLGNEPVTLVADLSAENGVAAEGPVPDNLEELLEGADQVTALYGTQQVGPVGPPPPQLVDAFTDACEKLAG